MADRIVPLTPEETRGGQNMLPGTTAQIVLHNHLVQQIADTRLLFDTADTMEKVIAIQAEIKAYTHLLRMIHSRDSQETKKIYE